MKTFFFILLAILMAMSTYSLYGCEQTSREPNLVRVSYHSDAMGEDREYFVYLPAGYDDDNQADWPVLLFLHGNGERGDAQEELDFVMVHGPLYEAWVQKRDLPFIIVAPQLPMYHMGEVDYIANRSFSDIPVRLEEGVPPRPEVVPPAVPVDGISYPGEMPLPVEGPLNGWYRLEKDVDIILDQVKDRFRTDQSRVYVTGISYGGFGTWYIASRMPERFAAIAPVVGFAHPDLVDPIATHRIPVWCFSAGRDLVVRPEYFYPAINRLEELGHKNVILTNHETEGHDAWVRIYAGEDIYNWLLKHNKGE